MYIMSRYNLNNECLYLKYFFFFVKIINCALNWVAIKINADNGIKFISQRNIGLEKFVELSLSIKVF